MEEFRTKARNKARMLLEKRNTCLIITKYVLRILKHGIDSDMAQIPNPKGDIDIAIKIVPDESHIIAVYGNKSKIFSA